MSLTPWSLALASSIPVLGLESVCPRKGCPWPRIFLCPCPWPRALCVLDSTSAGNTGNVYKYLLSRAGNVKIFDNVKSSFTKRQDIFPVILALCFILKIF